MNDVLFSLFTVAVFALTGALNATQPLVEFGEVAAVPDTGLWKSSPHRESTVL